MEHGATIEPAMLVAGLLIVISIGLTRLSVRFGVPALLLFLATGMLAGSEGIGGIWFDSPALVWSVGVMVLAFLLFAGGLDTDAHHIRAVLRQTDGDRASQPRSCADHHRDAAVQIKQARHASRESPLDDRLSDQPNGRSG